MATLKDIANRAGISQGAVSRILNNDHTLSVSEQTRENVYRIAAELGYKSVAQRYREDTPQKPAVQSNTDITIGIAQMYDMDELKEDIYYMALMNEVDSYCFSKGWSTLSLYRNEFGRFYKNNSHHLNGIIAIGRFSHDEIEDFLKLTPYLVFMDSSPDDLHYFSIVPNYHMAVNQALTSFKEKGYDRIAYAGAVQTFDEHKKLSIDPRFYYYHNKMYMNNLYDEKLVIDSEKNNAKCAYKAMTKYIDTYKKPPEALFVASDAAAPGIMKALQEKGFSIPEDVGIITFNNTVWSKSSNPSLDSIEVYMGEHAYAAVECMERTWIEHPVAKRIVLPCCLIERGSIHQKSK